ncbi:Uncharacterised protein [Klebsiella pneumoniae]|uniref:Uncharacterized protein n=1 Tax=Klebsiella pneumoniae TaxID=573 RepID=A0A377X901_KLEPN|nr:Uncharacterised protein [Klebsiella pneumoniae]STV46785.1 Uncharacterised protein [Klebsiella pneumoniae subsp. rhinoscleromatis]STU07322.1 Uncharacterised protein [Klebsiella pneumoniae]STU47799.1 Uncharacterised protein [Klebsiella pneumoniae]STW99292.1 Uncharacterised protein [Klebsiella pneumoniae subsp. rhinoscleromatis]
MTPDNISCKVVTIEFFNKYTWKLNLHAFDSYHAGK